MKTHTSDFKKQISLLGKQQDVLITYNDTTLTTDQINSVTYSYKGSLLKSVMKELDIESNEPIPIGTEINFKYGILVGQEYEYLDYGQFIVKDIEKQEDTGSYSIVCYDKLLYSMVDYESVEVTFPTTVYSYLEAICKHLGLQLANSEFVNSDKSIESDLYLGLGYTFRDVLDEIAEATGSVICINSDDMVEVRYITETGDIIDEEYFKDINVKFGEKYGPINSIVLSRAEESDNVYLQDEISVKENGLCELKIVDNQIMNFNNRSDFLEGLLNALGGISYFLNDFSSTGIMYYDLLDRYTVHIGDNYYSCVMLNDEQDITQGLEEQIYTDKPETSETDYTKADKTDRKINQTYLMVDKQNQKIESVISQTNTQNQKIAQVTQTVNELNSKISDIADITTSNESLNGTVSFEKINQSEPIYVRIYPTGINISYLYPHANLFPSETLFPKVRTLRFTNTTTNEYFDYELPTDLLYYDAENYDEFILDYDAQSCVINKRVGYNADGTTYVLDAVKTIEYEYPRIELTDGDYTIELLGYHNAYIFVRLMAQNIYTTQFATKAELNSEISQTESEINLSVDKKLTSHPTTTQMNSAISVKANEITSTVSETYETKSNATTNYSKLTQTANSLQSQISANDTDISTIKQSVNEVNIEVGKKYNTSDFTNAKITAKINDGTSSVKISANKIELSATDILNLLAGNEINLSSKSITISSDALNIDENGRMTFYVKDLGDIFQVKESSSSKKRMYMNRAGLVMDSENETGLITLGLVNENEGILTLSGAGGWTQMRATGIKTPTLTQTSRESKKKNISEYNEKALDIVKDSTIYEFNFKSEDDKHKKHLGFVIGDEGGKYKTPEQVISNDREGIESYSMTSILWKAFQEYIVEKDEQIKQLQNEIKELKESEK